ncbi:MAG: thiamine phosphate synthase [Flavobacteriales bacterium]
MDKKGALEKGRFQYISSPDETGNHLPGIQKALDSGIQWIQLRMKNRSVQEIENQSIELIKLAKPYQAICILNDYYHKVQDLGFDGVHLGKADAKPDLVRGIFGDSYLIGQTCHTLQEFQDLDIESTDYVGFGPYKSSETKTNLTKTHGLAGFNSILNQLNLDNLPPIVGIGGLTIQDIPDILSTKIHGIAASALVKNNTTKDLQNLIKQIKEWTN